MFAGVCVCVCVLEREIKGLSMGVRVIVRVSDKQQCVRVRARV